MKRKKILVINGQYFPGYKGGGPIRSCYNMIENLADKFEFYVLTSDRDYKSNKPYENIKVNDWNQIDSAKVFYISPNKQNIRGFYKILNENKFDIIYLNGFFSPIFTIKPLILKRLGKLHVKKVILTPRGDFTGGCENKKLKKYLYIYLSKIIGLYSGLKWHATSELEADDIRKKFKNSDIFVVSNLSDKYKRRDKIIEKNEGELRLVFISRIFPKKNLKFALEILEELKYGNIIFDIYGPMEDYEYWKQCKVLINKMSTNVKIEYKGEIEHSEVKNVFSKYHAFLFPTLGENYGHVIVEALKNNCIAILSKKVTPWDSYIDLLDVGADLNDKEKFKEILERFIKLDNRRFESLVKKSNDYVYENLNNELEILKYLDMFK